MEQYYTPLLTYRKLYNKAKPHIPQLTLKQAREFVDKQERSQLFKKPRKDLYTPIMAPDHSYQCDLLFFNHRGRDDPVFVLVEITTRRAFLRPMPNKTAQATAAALQSVLDEGTQVKFLEHDDGKEFQGAFKNLCIKHNITDITFPSRENSKTSLGKVERLNLSVRTWFEKSYSNQPFHQAIKEIETYYNEQEHSATHQRPIDADPDTARLPDLQRAAQVKDRISKTYRPGQKVRVREERDIFRKKSKAKWKPEIQTIQEIQGPNITLKNDDEPHRAWELLPIAADTAKAPKQTTIPKTKPGIRKLQKEIEARNIQPQPRTRAKPPAPTPPEPKPAPKPKPPKEERVLLPERILNHQVIKLKGRNQLFLEVQWKGLTPEQNETFKLQPVKNFATPEGLNPLVAKYLRALKKANPQEWKRIDKYF